MVCSSTSRIPDHIQSAVWGVLSLCFISQWGNETKLWLVLVVTVAVWSSTPIKANWILALCKVWNCISGWKTTSCGGNDNGWWAVFQEKWTSEIEWGMKPVWRSIKLVLSRILCLWSNCLTGSTLHSTEKKFVLELKVISHRLQVSFLLFEEVGTCGSLNASINCWTCSSVTSTVLFYSMLK